VSFLDSRNIALVFKALSDEKRINILSMLSQNELCACRILEEFDITQPTLSHHMKVLCGCGLVKARKEGKWSYYTVNEQCVEEIIGFLKKTEGK